MKMRSFIAFDIPDPVRAALSKLITDLQGHTDEVKWAKPESLHVTLRFFGDVEEEMLRGVVADRITQVTARAQPMALECAGVGVFPNWKYPRIIWAGFSGAVDPVIQLHDELNHELTGLPLKPDERAFRLHLTIGRAKAIKRRGSLVKRVESLGPVSFGNVPVNQLVLYKSELTKEGAVYTALQTFNLGKE